MKKNQYERIAYSVRRLNTAVDRIIVAKTPEEKRRAQAWARAWGVRGQFALRVSKSNSAEELN
ncbi:hypothetical protein AAKU64_004079 [Undibacterium sp. GrIS 1.8]